MKLFSSEIIKLINFTKSSPVPNLSTERYFFAKSLTKSGFCTEALYQLLFFAAITLVLIQFVRILYFPNIFALLMT